MKKGFLVFYITIIFVSIFATHTVAIMDFKAKGVDANSTSIVTDLFRDALFNKNIFTIVDRDSMQQILKEQNLQQSMGCNSEECAVQIGKILGVNSIIIGTLGKLGDVFILSVRMVSIENAKIIWAKSAKIYDFKRIDEGVSVLVDDLVNSYRTGKLNFKRQQVLGAIQQNHQNVQMVNSNSNKTQNVMITQQKNGQNVTITQGQQQSSSNVDFRNSLIDSSLSAKIHTNKFIWFSGGCLFGLLGVGAAYLISPSPPAAALIGKNSSYIAVYTKNYKKVAKGIQSKQAMYGCLTSSMIGILYILL